jgi:succinate dehydrogenase / fumarate reductase, cytochrome b subunit
MSSDIRPTSPHLTIYKPQITSVLSISHRLTGLALYAGTALVVCWLYKAAYAPTQYSELHSFMTSTFGYVLMIGWTAAFYYHLANGLRHLFWDMGKGFEIKQVNRSGWLVILFTILMTGFTWCPYMMF